MSLLYSASLPIALSKAIPGVNEGGVVFDGPRETLFCLRAVIREDIQGLSTEVPVLHMWEGGWEGGGIET